MIARIDDAKRTGNTLGGICEVVVTGLPVGLGSHVSWDRKLDGRLGQAMLSIPAVKGVEIGLGFETARRTGADVHDEIALAPDRARAGDVRRVDESRGRARGRHDDRRAARDPRGDEAHQHAHAPAETIDVRTAEPAAAAAERSDVTAVPAMGVIAEAMAAFVLAQAVLEKFGGDSLGELRRNLDGYLAQVAGRLPDGPALPSVESASS